MAQIEKEFTFETPICTHKGKKIADAQIQGIGYWDTDKQSDWNNGECDIDCIASYKITRIAVNMGSVWNDMLSAYNLSKLLHDSFSDLIDNATLAHMEYIFQGVTEDEDEDEEYEETPIQEHERTEMQYIIKSNNQQNS